MSRLDQITHFHGKLSDLKVTWWPFLFLKPTSAQIPITWRRVALMVPCFAGWLLMGWVLKSLMLGEWESLKLPRIGKSYLYLVLGFTLWFNVVTAPLWNRRARLMNETVKP